MRTLPLRLSPIVGESLPGYVARYAHTFGLAPGDIVRALGLDRGTGTVAAAGRYGVMLSADQLERAAFATGIAVEVLEGMLLSRYAGRAFDRSELAAPVPLAASVQGREVRTRSSRFCPTCLRQDGAWRLRWQLAWSAVCARHGVLLADRCPKCQAVTMIAWGGRSPRDHRGPLTDPTYCSRRIGHELCRGLLTTAHAFSLPDEVTAAQRRIDSVLDGELKPILAGEETSPPTYLYDMRMLCNLLDRHLRLPAADGATAGLLPGRRVHDDPAALAAVLPEALRLADLPDQAALVDRLRSLADRRYLADGRTLEVAKLRPMSDRLRAVLRQAASQTVWASPSRQAGFHPSAHRRPSDLDPRLQPRHVPQLFWPEDYEREISALFDFDDFTHRLGRRFCSVLLARILTPLDWHAAVRYLDFPETFINAGYNTTSVKLRAIGHFEELVRRVKQIANQHAKHGLIDYKQRRARLADWTGIDRDTWPLLQPRLAQNHRWRADAPSRRARAGVWLWCQLTSGHERAAPIELPTSNLAHQGEFIRDALPDLHERLMILGQLLLATPTDARHTLPAQLEAALRERGYVIFRPATTDRRHRPDGGERRERPKPPRIPPIVSDRVLAHISAHTGVDIPTITTGSFPGMQTPPAVIHARLLAAELLQRIAPTSWNAVGEAINQDGNQLADRQHGYQAACRRQPRLADDLEQLQRAIENPQTPAPIPPSTPHQQRMREVADAIQARSAELLAAVHGADVARRASITICRQHTDLTCDDLAAIHHVKAAQTAYSRTVIEQLRREDPAFEHRYRELLAQALRLRQRAGYANPYLRRGLTRNQANARVPATPTGNYH